MRYNLYAGKAKAEIRKLILADRDALGVTQISEKSLQAKQNAMVNIKFAPGCVISGFFPIRSEIDPRPLMDELRQKGATICLPVVIDKTILEFREFDHGTNLVDTGFGTRGPDINALIVDPEIMLVPLSVFDRKGGRIGYGAGYYDRAIGRLIDLNKPPFTIGMAFDCQQYDLVPQEPHDVLLDAIVTESKFRKRENK